MVDLFSGNFHYSIPLLDVGGYPLALGYNSGIDMDQEASWVGLGWDLNPGAITRNMRGLPDDFNGTDTIQKIQNMKANKTRGYNLALSAEVLGIDKEKLKKDGKTQVGVDVGISTGLVYNNYKGWGIETGVNAGINAAGAALGDLTGSLSITNSSQEGFSVGTGISYSRTLAEAKNGSSLEGNVGLGTGYNSRSGMKNLEVNAGPKLYIKMSNNAAIKKNSDQFLKIKPGISSSLLTFAYPSYLPRISLPYTNSSYTYTAKVGGEVYTVDWGAALTGYGSTQEFAPADQRLALPAYGYMNYQEAGSKTAVLLDFNREKDIPYHETPAIPNIGVPAYTYDVFAISGEGIGGNFRSYRNDVGHVFDPYMKSKTKSDNVSADLGLGSLFHAGADLSLTYAYTEAGPWETSTNNFMGKRATFSSSNGKYEASYFRNPGEMTVNNKDYFKAIGDDDVVAVKLLQSGASDPNIIASGTLNKYKNARLTGTQVISPRTFNNDTRPKRTQVISYLTAKEASVVGFPKYIENYGENKFTADACPGGIGDDAATTGSGLLGLYYYGTNFDSLNFKRQDDSIYFLSKDAINVNTTKKLNEKFSVRWIGRVKAPVSGTYTFYTQSDDGVVLNLNDKNLIGRWNAHPVTLDSATVNLVEGEFYNLELNFYQELEKVAISLEWKYPGQPRVPVPKRALYNRSAIYESTIGNVTLEKRVNTFRNENHISEIDVLNDDGKRYVYGIPVYNLQQREASFSVTHGNQIDSSALVKFTAQENSVANKSGVDNYYSSELTPAYAHSFLLTAVLSPDYQDLTGDGISADDRGDAVKFNYSKTASATNVYSWRAPLGEDMANYNEGLKTDSRDDKGSYVYGEKELWYLNSMESKNMIAVFRVSKRDDLPAVTQTGKQYNSSLTRKLDRIDLYTKAEFKKNNPKPLKSIHFEYGYDLCKGANGAANTQGKLTLRKIWFTYNGNKRGERHPYIFNYDNPNPSYSAKQVDRWSTYKPAKDNPNGENNIDYPYSLQDSTKAANNVAVWSLSSIKLPSGGRIKVDYESDDYAFVQNKRAAQLFNIAGFSASKPESTGDLKKNLYELLKDYSYVAVTVPKAVKTDAEVYARYLDGIEKLFFRLYVTMPSDKYGSGAEYVNCYATPEAGSFGRINDNTIWFKIKPIDNNGNTDLGTSVYSPLTKAAISYLRLNLGSKAYPGSEVGDDLSIVDVIKMIASQGDNIVSAMLSFDKAARMKGWAKSTDFSRSYVRLNNPYFKKYGGGLRVKRITTYDNWDSMTNQKLSTYGQEYQYTTTRKVNGVDETISSGVATYEPMIGSEENPWKQPLEYTQQVAALGPTALGYTEVPLGEQFFPSPSVGYSKVRVRTIHAKKARSADGFTESCFYTSYDFPTLTDFSTLEKKRYKPALANFLHINAKHYLATTQGFKVELNDMNRKVKSTATYSETDSLVAITETKNYYRVDNQNAEFKHLNNTVWTMDAKGNIDSTAVIGKDMELMMDMREEHGETIAYTFAVNVDVFTFAWPPVLGLPGIYALYNNEETKYQSAAISKVIFRHGILDSAVVTDKGSRVSTRNLMYDSETGNVVLTSTQNEYNDPIYNFTLPAGWAYDGMSGAYKNIDVVLKNITLRQGRITNALNVSDYFTGGDKILIYSKPQTGGADCNPEIATFPLTGVMYAVDVNKVKGGKPDIYFLDEDGQPFTGNDVSLKIVKSGRKNIETAVGAVTLLKDPRVKDNAGNYYLKIDSTSKVISASAVQYDDSWKVADSKKDKKVFECINEADPYSSIGYDAPNHYGSAELFYLWNPLCPSGYDIYYLVPWGYPKNYQWSYIPEYATRIAAEKLALKWAEGEAYAVANGYCINETGIFPVSSLLAKTTTTSSVSARKTVIQNVTKERAVDSVAITISIDDPNVMVRLMTKDVNNIIVSKVSSPLSLKVAAGSTVNGVLITGDGAVIANITGIKQANLPPKTRISFVITPMENAAISIVRP
ncbi:PA14 domain-containing protein [Chitinophaga sancti]|uniref:PA14 domain-containing protein n=1 Tax=Chitinophaga sancti TaxID=1004 RepID=UPI003F7B28B6